MNERAVDRLRRKFTLTAMLSFALVMLVLSSFLMLTNQWITRQDVKKTLDYLVDVDGELIVPEEDDVPEDETNEEEETEQPGQGWKYSADFRKRVENLIGIGRTFASPEFWYSTRYFAVVTDQEGNVSEIKADFIASMSDDEILLLAQRMLKHHLSFGKVGDYYYEKAKREDGSYIVVALESTSYNAWNVQMFYMVLMMMIPGLILSFVFSRMISRRMVETEMRYSAMQKEFITNASHELKTPLAVIRANTEILEMAGGENEWTTSSLHQIARLEGLIQNLVQISRGDEKNNGERVDLDVSKVIEEAVDTFRPVASQEDIQMETAIAPNVHLRAQEGQIRQLAGLLIDNAIKYCDEKGTVQVELVQRIRGIRLSVSNPYQKGETMDVSHFFDRFYRADEAHNTDKGGYGVGLSVAQQIVASYHGKIDATWKNGVITFWCEL